VHSIIAPRKCILRPENATVALGYCLDFPELSLDPVSKPDSLILQSTGNGLINEAEFLQWVGRIQALRDDQQSHEDSKDSKPVDEADDVTEDLIAAFRYTVFMVFSISPVPTRTSSLSPSAEYSIGMVMGL